MRKKKNGYNRYKVIFDNIRKLCYALGKPKDIIEGPLEGISEETCEDDCKHYILGNGLHVYIREEKIYITETDVQYWGDERARSVEELTQFFVSYNESSIDCICHASNGMPFSLVQYFNHNVEDGVDGRCGKDNVFIPNSFESSDETSGGIENVPADIGDAISGSLGENTQLDVRVICNKIIALNRKIKQYEREPVLYEILQLEKRLEKPRQDLERLQTEVKEGNNKATDKVAEIEAISREIAEIESKIQRIKNQSTQILNEDRVEDGRQPND